MKQLLILVLFFLSPIFIFAEDLEENNECRKFYKLKLQDNKYFRYKPKQIIGYSNEETFESTWHIDCKNSKVFSTGGIFEREYTLEKHRYDSNSKVYLVDMLGEEEGDIHKYTLKIKYIDDDKAYIYGYYDNKLEDIYTNNPNKYKVIVK